jgi:wyosine [tRNA(Phe)-imidazoG37] synthetase (radical SAM superfamily)
MTYPKDLIYTEQDKKNVLIFYGAGSYACKNEHKIKVELGLTPVVYVDKDPKRHGEVFYGVKILSLVEAIKIYPNYILMLTVGDEWVKSVIEYIAENYPEVDLTRIRYPFPMKWGLGCSMLGAEIVFGEKIKTCCFKNDESITISNPLLACFDEYRSKYYKIISENLDNKTTFCTGCDLLKNGYWLLNPLIKCATLEPKPGDICNFNCKDCISANTLQKKRSSEIDVSEYEILKSFINTKKYSGNLVTVIIGNGEPTLNKYFKDISQLIIDNELHCIVLTNASVYNKDLERLLSLRKAVLNIDLSAGTDETYKKIKGYKKFEQVKENIIKYSLCGTSDLITLKYIVFHGINDNIKDIDLFIDFAKLINPMYVQLSQNAFEKNTQINKNTVNYFINKLRSENIKIKYNAHLGGIVEHEKLLNSQDFTLFN